MQRHVLESLLTIGLTSMFSHPIQAINPGHAGAWIDPDHAGQGIVFELVPTDHQLTAYWFTWAEDGARQWLVGQGAYDGDQAQLQFVVAEGGRFLDSVPVDLVAAGQASVTFEDCRSARLDYADSDGVTSTVDLVRLAPSAGCFEAEADGPTEYAVDDRGALVSLNGDWHVQTCVAIDANRSLSEETLRFDGDRLAIEMTLHASADCSGPPQSARVDLLIRAAGRAVARGADGPVPVTRFDMIDLASGETVRQVLHVESTTTGHRLTHGVFAGDGGEVDADGYPVDLHPVYADRAP